MLKSLKIFVFYATKREDLKLVQIKFVKQIDPQNYSGNLYLRPANTSFYGRNLRKLTTQIPILEEGIFNICHILQQCVLCLFHSLFFQVLIQISSSAHHRDFPLDCLKFKLTQRIFILSTEDSPTHCKMQFVSFSLCL